MNGAHLPHIDVSKIIRDQPASRCHTISAVFGAAQTERSHAQREPYPLLAFRIQNTLIPKLIQPYAHCYQWSLQYKMTPNQSQQITMGICYIKFFKVTYKFLKCNEMVVITYWVNCACS